MEYGILTNFYRVKGAKLLTAEASDTIFSVDLDLSVFSNAYGVHGTGSCALSAFFTYRSVYNGLGLEDLEQLFIAEQMYFVKTVGQNKVFYDTSIYALTRRYDLILGSISSLL